MPRRSISVVPPEHFCLQILDPLRDVRTSKRFMSVHRYMPHFFVLNWDKHKAASVMKESLHVFTWALIPENITSQNEPHFTCSAY